MGFADHYLAKHYENVISLHTPPDDDLNIIVTIPAYNEPGLFHTLESLFLCNPPEGKAEVLILINWPENAPEEIKQEDRKLFQSLKKWIEEHKSDFITFYTFLHADIPGKYAGVGLARKILMDEAIRRFNIISQPSGIIASLDADALCTSNYLTELEKHFINNPKTDGCVIYFEHPLSGSEFSQDIYHAICLYEIHLRYYVQSIRYTGYRNAYHTVGSAFATIAKAYCSQGGMNKRKAGEDFYFLQKFFDLGNFSELNSTCVIPSPRPSDRVPFGTGPVIRKLELEKLHMLYTYNPVLFEILKDFFCKIPYLFTKKKILPDRTVIQGLPACIREFLEKEKFHEALTDIIGNVASPETFKKRFFRWFNMFKILKFLNYGRKFYPDIPVTQAASELLNKTGRMNFSLDDPIKLLEILRHLERGHFKD